MPTRYPTSLPDIDLPDRWGFESGDSGGDPDEGTAYSDHTITAPDAETAERRVLSVIAYDYSDMRCDGYLEDCVASAKRHTATGFTVRVAYRKMS